MTKSTAAIRTVNVTRMYRESTADERVEGLLWYPRAFLFAEQLAHETGHAVHTAAAVIAAVSPRLSWDLNQRLAARILRTGDTSSGYLSTGLERARRLLDGERPFDVLRSHKILNFYVSISSAGAEGVCIDRHAFDVATGVRHEEATRPGISVGRYEACSQAYRNAARRLRSEFGNPSLTAAEVQATTWVTWRNRLKETAA